MRIIEINISNSILSSFLIVEYPGLACSFTIL